MKHVFDVVAFIWRFPDPGVAATTFLDLMLRPRAPRFPRSLLPTAVLLAAPWDLLHQTGFVPLPSPSSAPYTPHQDTHRRGNPRQGPCAARQCLCHLTAATHAALSPWGSFAAPQAPSQSTDLKNDCKCWSRSLASPKLPKAFFQLEWPNRRLCAMPYIFLAEQVLKN